MCRAYLKMRDSNEEPYSPKEAEAATYLSEERLTRDCAFGVLALESEPVDLRFWEAGNYPCEDGEDL